MSAGRLVVIGNPENRRVGLFQQAAARAGLPAPQVLSYEDLLAGNIQLADAVPCFSTIRIESPGENSRVEYGLVARGECELAPVTHSPHTKPVRWVSEPVPAVRRASAPVPAVRRPSEPVAAVRPPSAPVAAPRPTRFLSTSSIPDRAIDHGRIYHPRLWYLGFRGLLVELDWQLERRQVTWMNHPREIALMFDKFACQRELARFGIPVPEPLGIVSSYVDLRTRMRDQRVSRVFVKLLHGSSASGVIALQCAGRKVDATTSVEMVDTGGNLQLYNSLRVRRYDREPDVGRLIDALGEHGICAEAWLPKAGWRGAVFDLRVMVIAGQVRHVVMRTSRGPLTNLHLGNRRGDIGDLLEHLPAVAREQAWETCRRIAEVFPNSLYFGVDLMFTPGFRRHAVLEVNAFGDLLPNVRSAGLDTYEAELQALRGEW